MKRSRRMALQSMFVLLSSAVVLAVPKPAAASPRFCTTDEACAPNCEGPPVGWICNGGCSGTCTLTACDGMGGWVCQIES